MHCTIGDVRDKVHRGELEALRWGQQFRFFREEVLSSMTRYRAGDPPPADENIRFDTLPDRPVWVNASTMTVGTRRSRR